MAGIWVKIEGGGERSMEKIQNNVSQINPFLYISICGMVGVIIDPRHISRLPSLIVLGLLRIVREKKIITLAVV